MGFRSINISLKPRVNFTKGEVQRFRQVKEIEQRKDHLIIHHGKNQKTIIEKKMIEKIVETINLTNRILK